MMSQMWLTSPGISANAPITETNTRPPFYLMSSVTIGPSEPDEWPLDVELINPRRALAILSSCGLSMCWCHRASA